MGLCKLKEISLFHVFFHGGRGGGSEEEGKEPSNINLTKLKLFWHSESRGFFLTPDQTNN